MPAPRSLVPAIAAVSAIAAIALAGCAAHVEAARPCPEGCEAGKSCVVGRCRPSEEVPSPADTLRVILTPVDVAVIAEKGSQGDSPPETVALGRASDGTVEILLRFSATWRDDADVVSAFVVLDPIAGAPPPSSPASFEMARILEPWRSSTTTWGRQPRLDLPERAGAARAVASTPVRIDVTALVQKWRQRSRDDHGIALLVRGDDAVGGAFSLGTTSGAGPRLEAYVR